ncbi:hypothetical protein VNI00_013597 [Paramarasmius palmivorus]|uniref:MYND-type domain-containing protein n=1 Tax=Paramarasmius palmivorus TaxID=297713 RepID=A0AAW0BWK4_9AGAR
MSPKASDATRWHFDARYIPIEPNPCHVLFIVNMTGIKKHVERLPVGLDKQTSGIKFFPEIASEAAPEVAKALIHAFKQHLGGTDVFPFGPSGSLSTDDRSLAQAVGAELRKLGIGQERSRIEYKYLISFAQGHFEATFKDLKKQFGATEKVTQLLDTPESIGFHNFRSCNLKARRPEEDPFDESVQRLLEYMHSLLNARPAISLSKLDHKLDEEMDKLRRLFHSKPTPMVEEEADRGVPESQLDFALRLQAGIDCDPDRRGAWKYFIKTATNPSAAHVTRSIAHVLLMDWHLKSPDLRNRNLYLAAHHASQALIHSDGRPSPAVIFFAEKEIHKRVEMGDLPVLRHMYEKVWEAREKRQAEYKAELAMGQEKRLAMPNRYRCAAVGCGVEADRGKMLQQCSCLFALPNVTDWKNHKAFCKPGMPCSVIDTGTPSTGLGKGTKKGALGVPVTTADGTSTFLTTSTIGSSELKEIRDLARTMSRGSDVRVDLPVNLQMERYEI